MTREGINKQVADHFNQRKGKYSHAWTSLAKQKLSDLELKFISNSINPVFKQNNGHRVKSLDIGIGNGRISELIVKENVRHYAIDISKEMVRFCLRKFKHNKRIKEIIVHDIINPLPVRWGKVDIVTAIRVLSYTPVWRNTLKNIYRTMKKNGVFVFSFPNKYSSTYISYLLPRKKLTIGKEAISYRELVSTLNNVGFSEIEIVGLNRGLDIFYDWSNSKFTSEFLMVLEKLLFIAFGKTFLTREFYVKCKK